jgi:hypothetical protein
MNTRIVAPTFILAFAASVAVQPTGSATTILPLDVDCDVCNDQAASPMSNCKLHHGIDQVHQRIGGGASGGWFMQFPQFHLDDRWYCRDCSHHPFCPEGEGGVEDDIEMEEEVGFAMEALRRGDVEAFGAHLAALPVATINVDREGLAMAVVDCRGRTITEFPLTPELIRLLEE